MASPEDFANAQLYLHKVVHAAAVGGQVDAADVQPLILQAVQQLNGINQLLNQHINDSNQQFNQINHRLNNIDQQFNNINQQFNGINQHFEGVNQQFEGVNQHLHVIDERLNRIEGRLVDMNEVLCQAYNQGCKDGAERQYKVIPFRLPDGGVELPETVGLPPLRNARAIENLEDAHLNTYLLQYNIPRAGNLNRRTKVQRLKAFIGGTLSSS
ncbi:hypothetical protein EV401DRAFT_1934693 [Pisolithus croceorrhizus]|nr:hypothetical protein EV401DRAFT_1934693 [Pisolithus croceorrhizus]